MELRQLEYLLAVLEEGSFTRAANRLMIVQSAVSHRVGELERELGVQLIRRERPRILPTRPGQLFAARARVIMTEVVAAKEEILSLRGLTIGDVRFGATAPAGSLDVPRLIGTLRAHHPEVRVLLREGTGPELISLLRDDSIDLAVVSVAPADLPRGIDGLVIDTEQLVLAGPTGHPFETETVIPITKLDGVDLISFREGSSLRHATELVLDEARVTPHVIIESNEMSVLVGLVSHGLGLAILPRAFVEQASVPIWGRPLVPSINPPLTLVWREARRQSPAVEAFREHIIDQAPQRQVG